MFCPWLGRWVSVEDKMYESGCECDVVMSVVEDVVVKVVVIVASEWL